MIRRYWRRAVVLVLALGVGVLVGVLIAAPSATDIYNACHADDVSRNAGIPPGVTPGPVWQSRAPLTHVVVTATPATPAP